MNDKDIRILLADDDESISTTLEFILLDQGFKVEVVNNGHNALSLARDQFFNIAILDYHLPDTDGIMLGKNLKKLSNETEIIILTGQATLESAIKAVKENIYDYLTKPIDPDKLIEVIHSALEKQFLILENKRLIWELKTTNKKLEHLNKFKDGVISMISHDLRSPISSLKGFNYSLLAGYVGELTKEQKEIIETENDAIDTMMELINNILDMRQIEAGELRMNRKPSNVNENIVMPVVKRLKPQLSDKEINMKLDLSDEIKEVNVDALRISQVIQNLVQNSIKFTPKCGTIEVSTRLAGSNRMEIQVRDSGKGIPEESLNTIFEMFYTEDTGRSSRSKTGRGLGLAICKEIVKAHNGIIWAESDGIDMGSRFIILIPLDSSAEATHAPGERNVKENTHN